MQMLRWLDRSPESFVPSSQGADAETTKLPYVGPHQILRFDTRNLYSALDAQRLEGGMTWKQVSDQIGGVNAAGLTRLSKGGRGGFPQVMRITRWLGSPAAHFTRASES